MSKQFFPNLSQNYMEILEDDEHYDITIEVGEDPNVKIFRSHMIILRYRSPFLRRTLSSNKKNDNGDLTHIKLSNISPEIFQIILKQQLYEELLNSYLNPNSKPSDNILLPRNRIINGIIDSKIVNLNIASLISRCIDKIDIKSKYAYTRELYLPFKFKLLLRGSRDGFSPKKFHKLCDNILSTVTFIKVKGTEEIIGGYNPSIWKSSSNIKSKFSEWGKAKDSFIFSFKNKDNFKDPILSHVKNIDHALLYHSECGPVFGNHDLNLHVNEDDDSKDYDRCWCEHECYDKKIRDTEDRFSIEDYEVFQILYRND
ncbi:uncharacterized protein OCT59_029164 [Rhizophagus irregularis]|uniref:uncharacterized protein n=1 Tax=Rhizophagus irregularis TaxID=588596 RepID=UPI003317FA85|nr:hypothetical protein OCT59_029164 [Rhizophagus irregularis]